MKTRNELNKIEKVMLLKSIAAGTINRSQLTPETLFSTKKSDAFIGLMVCATNEEATVICIGEDAKLGMKAIDELIQNIKNEETN